MQKPVKNSYDQIDNSALTFYDHHAQTSSFPARERSHGATISAVFDYSVLQFHRNDTQRLAGITSGLILSDEAAERLTASVGDWVTGIVLSLVQPVVHKDGMPD